MDLDYSVTEGTGTTPFNIYNLARVCNRIAYNLEILIEPLQAKYSSEALEVVRNSEDRTWLLDMDRMLTDNKDKNKDQL